MSGFDNLMRTDQHISQNRQFYDQQKYQSDRGTAQAIGNIPGQMQQTQMNQQAMEQQQLQGALMKKTVEADLRAQEAAMEQQFHANKMNQLLMADQVQASHENVVNLQNRNAADAFRLEQMRSEASDQPQKSRDRNLGLMLSKMGAHGVASTMNGRIEMDGSGGMRLVKFKDKKERDEFLKANPRDGAGTSEWRYTADGAMRAAQQLGSTYPKNPMTGEPDFGKSAQGLADAEKYRFLVQSGSNAYEQRLRGQDAPPGAMPPGAAAAPPGQDPGVGDPPPMPVAPDSGQPYGPRDPSIAEGDVPGAMTVDQLDPPLPKDGPRLSQGAVQQANAGYAHAQRDPEWQTLSKNMGEQAFARLLTGVGVAAEDLVKSGRMPADRASQVVMQSIMRGGSESAYYMTMAGYSEPQIRAWLSNRGQSDSAVDAILSRLNAHVSKRKGERK